jgi:hypothetical protein
MASAAAWVIRRVARAVMSALEANSSRIISLSAKGEAFRSSIDEPERQLLG